MTLASLVISIPLSLEKIFRIYMSMALILLLSFMGSIIVRMPSLLLKADCLMPLDSVPSIAAFPSPILYAQLLLKP